MARLLPFSGKQKQIKVAVCGLSGTIDRSTIPGVGKSWLCSRLVHSEYDSFQEASVGESGEDRHSSSISHEDFYSREVANDHFLYYGRRTVSVPTDEMKTVEVDLHVVEQTEFMDQRGENLPFHSLGAPDKSYSERATKRSLVPSCSPKHIYINRTQVRCSMRREKFIFKGKTHLGQLYPMPFKVDAYVITYDGSLLHRAAVGMAQKSKLADLLRQLSNKGRVDRTIIVVTKCDDLSKAAIDAAIKDVHGLCERVQLPTQIPVVAVSAKDNVNIEFLQQMIILCAWNRSDVVRVRPYDEAVRVQEGSLGSDEKKLEAAVLAACEKDQPTWPIFHHDHRKTPWLKHLVDYRGLAGVNAIFDEKVRPRLRVKESSTGIWSSNMANVSEDWVEVPPDCYPMSSPGRARAQTDRGQLGCTSGSRLKRGQGKVRVNSDQLRSNVARPTAAADMEMSSRSLPANVLSQAIRSPHRDHPVVTERQLPTPPGDVYRNPTVPSSMTSPERVGATNARDGGWTSPSTSGSSSPSSWRPKLCAQDSGGSGTTPSADAVDGDVFYEEPTMTSPTSSRTPPLPPTPEADTGSMLASPLVTKKAKPPKPPRTAQLQDKLHALLPGLRRASEPAGLNPQSRITADRRSASDATLLTAETSRPFLGSASPSLFRNAVDETGDGHVELNNEVGASPDDVAVAAETGVKPRPSGSVLVREDALMSSYVSRVTVAGISGSYEMVADAAIPAVETDGVPVQPVLLSPVEVAAEETPYSYARFLAAANRGQAPSTSVRNRRGDPSAAVQLHGIPEYCEPSVADSGGNGVNQSRPPPQQAQSDPPPPSQPAPPFPSQADTLPPSQPARPLPETPEILLQSLDDPLSLLCDTRLHKLLATRGVPSETSGNGYISQLSTLSIDTCAPARKNMSLPDMISGMTTSTDSSGYVKTGSGGKLTTYYSDSDTDTDSLN